MKKTAVSQREQTAEKNGPKQGCKIAKRRVIESEIEIGATGLSAEITGPGPVTTGIGSV